MIDYKRHELSVDIRDEHARFDADPLRLSQILSNLLTNAAKYTDAHGEIRLTARCGPEEVTIGVADTGIGLSAEALPKIFEMFAQVHSARDRSEGGLGIGLALKKALVDMHGGKIEARSAGLGRGSEFTVRLPRRETNPEQRESMDDDAPVSTASRRVLIADDNRDSAESLATLLQLDGHEVTIVHDGAAALAAFANLRPHVVLLDIGMPHLNGHEVVRTIRQNYPTSGARLIAITGWGQENDKMRSDAAGFDFHLTKPVDIQRLSGLLKVDVC